MFFSIKMNSNNPLIAQFGVNATIGLIQNATWMMVFFLFLSQTKICSCYLFIRKYNQLHRADDLSAQVYDVCQIGYDVNDDVFLIFYDNQFHRTDDVWAKL